MDTYKTQHRNERRFFSGDLERLWVWKQTCVGHQVSFPLNGRWGRGNILSLQAQTTVQLQPLGSRCYSPILVALGVQSFLVVVVELAHGEDGCIMGPGVCWAPYLGDKGLEISIKQCHSSLSGISSFLGQLSGDELYSFQVQVFTLLLVYG